MSTKYRKSHHEKHGKSYYDRKKIHVQRIRERRVRTLLEEYYEHVARMEREIYEQKELMIEFLHFQAEIPQRLMKMYERLGEIEGTIAEMLKEQVEEKTDERPLH